MAQITLKAATTLWSVHTGRGIPSRSLILSPGTSVDYTKTVLDPNCDYLPYLSTVHTVAIIQAGQRFEANRRTMVLRKPFAAATYYGDAISACGRGLWSCGGDGRIYTDDGFCNLVEAVDTVPVNFYGTVKAVEDCVIGWHYWIPTCKAAI